MMMRGVVFAVMAETSAAIEMAIKMECLSMPILFV